MRQSACLFVNRIMLYSYGSTLGQPLTQRRPWRKALIGRLVTGAYLWLGPRRLNLRFSLAMTICESWAIVCVSSSPCINLIT